MIQSVFLWLILIVLVVLLATEEDVKEEETQLNEKKNIRAKNILDGSLLILLLVIGVLLAFLNKNNLESIGVLNPPIAQTILWGFG